MVIVNGKKEITKQLVKNSIINFIIFTVILLIFDFIIYNQVVISLYRDIDKQLIDSISRVQNLEDKAKIEVEENIEKKQVNNQLKNKMNPRLIIIERNKNGEILNEDALGNLISYNNQIKFNYNNIENIYNIEIAENIRIEG